MISAFIIDLRAAWLGLRRTPALLVTASIVLGLGLAATVFMLTVVNTFYFKSPPFRDAERIYRVFGQHELTRDVQDEIRYLDFLALRESSDVEDAAAYSMVPAVVTGGGAAQRFDGAEVSPNFFELLGATTELGRTITARDGLPGAEPVALLNFDVWTSQYAGDRSIVGKRITLNGEPTTVVGVLSPGFGLIGGEGVWTPISRDPLKEARDDSAYWVWMLAKAKAGISDERLAVGLRSTMDQLQREHPQSNESLSVTLLPVGAGIIGHASIDSLKRQLLGAYITLLIACLTVAGLLFVRANYRQYETAMRSALGARRLRLIQLSLCEALIISGFAVAVAYFVSMFALQYYNHLIDEIGVYGGVPPWWNFEIDWQVAIVSVLVAAVSALLAGAVPAIEASRGNIGQFLRDRAFVSGGPRLTRFMGAMVCIELAAAVALLCGATLLARGAYTTVGKGFGVEPETIMTASVRLPENRYLDAEYAQFMSSALDGMRSRPGVEGAAFTNSLPGLGSSSAPIAVEAADRRPIAELPISDEVSVSSGYFAAIGGRVLAGREFDSRDSSSAPLVALVNSEFVSRNFSDGRAVGKRIAFPNDDDSPKQWLTIVGVVDNMLHSVTWDEYGDWKPTVYTPLAQWTPRFTYVVVRGGGTVADQAKVVKDVIAGIDRDVPVYMLRSLVRAQAETRAGYQLGSVSMLGFSVIAVILAIVGTYVVLSFTVQLRTKEVAIRRALGASNSQVVSSVIRGTVWQVVVGLAIGAALTPFAVTLVSSLMEGLQTKELWIYALSFGLVALAVAIASTGPARRALRVEPAVLLRVE